MNGITKRKALVLISIGMSIISFAQIISLYVEISDLTRGSFIGIGVGMLLVALIKGNFKSARSF